MVWIKNVPHQIIHLQKRQASAVKAVDAVRKTSTFTDRSKPNRTFFKRAFHTRVNFLKHDLNKEIRSNSLTQLYENKDLKKLNMEDNV